MVLSILSNRELLLVKNTEWLLIHPCEYDICTEMEIYRVVIFIKCFVTGYISMG